MGWFNANNTDPDNSNLSPYIKLYKLIDTFVDDPILQEPYDIQNEISKLDKLIDTALANRDRKAFMKLSHQRNILMLEA